MVESGDAFLSVQRIFERPHTRMVKYDDEVCLSFRYRFSSFLNKKENMLTLPEPQTTYSMHISIFK
jgi:hypothetical protein